ncbi:MAG: radical SAM family heme chaperone HemW [Candidatus Adiutrix sp.]
MTDYAGLYIHVPFCLRRCPYCDFYSISALNLIPNYIKSLAIEARQAAATWGPFDTIYIGGGSPSLLNDEGLKNLFLALSPLDLTAAREITLEANPEDVSPKAAQLWAEMGITRLSLGVQSFDDRWLSDVLGRGHSKAQNYQAIEILQKQTFDLSLDLIYGHPSQDLENWGSDIVKAADLKPHHISAYNLTVEPKTPLARSIAERFLPQVPPVEMVADMFLITREALVSKGYHRYEVSNFALSGHESKHNLKYWRREAYLGLGPSAHSFDGQKRMANVSSVRQWSSALNSGHSALALNENLDEKAVRLEQLMLGLRLAEGVPEALLPQTTKLTQFIESGHLIHQDKRIRPTEKGFLMADRIALELA